jgi:triosephosphate isomerase (TIM)
MAERRPIIIANWKLNGGLDLICTSVASFIGRHLDAEVAICPPYLYMRDMMTFLKYSELMIGSQNLSRYKSGAYTGETSAQMLRQAGCELCLIGHSERRAMFGENHEGCRIKVGNAFEHGLMPVLCIGESAEQRAAGQTESVLMEQIAEPLSGFDLLGRKLCIAYEPIWAIGTGQAATPEIAQEVHASIRVGLTRLFGEEVAQSVRILYGGSVNKSNAHDLLFQPEVDGLLVGGASLDPGHFLAICEEASRAARSRREVAADGTP